MESILHIQCNFIVLMQFNMFKSIFKSFKRFDLYINSHNVDSVGFDHLGLKYLYIYVGIFK